MDAVDQQPTPMGPFYEAVLTAMVEYEHADAAARNAVTSSTLATLARDYAATNDNAEHRSRLATDVAEDISLAEAGTIRRAAKAVELGMPGIICRARATGMEPTEIARQLGTTGSYVRRILRDNRTTLAEAVASLHEAGQKFGEAVAKTAAAVEATTGEQATADSAEGRAWVRDYVRRHNSGTRNLPDTD
ncbi:hypothetical protein OG909_12165 [Streptomyces sp. NBC_01754]|uniref:hypothetical protein n=1 Tax=Streptomyces sp. NBC_01754 TaxID=2975930 RepID=UPI002DD8CD1A|nr:hypothetical protein [Streptomyces sp. NBC_01754]WSC92989.1 hypothetical protein OG909_12165 [Streptomyces sp. NBC_01754]